MELFKRKLRQMPPIYSVGNQPEIIPAQPHYESVLEWLIGLSDEDYAKVVKVADIHRKAYAEAADALEEPLDPTTFIKTPPPPTKSMSGRFSDRVDDSTLLDDDDDISLAFLEDDIDTPASRKQSETAQKAIDGVKGKKVKVKS